MAGDLYFAFKRFKPSAYKLKLSGILSRRTLRRGCGFNTGSFYRCADGTSQSEKNINVRKQELYR